MITAARLLPAERGEDPEIARYLRWEHAGTDVAWLAEARSEPNGHARPRTITLRYAPPASADPRQACASSSSA